MMQADVAQLQQMAQGEGELRLSKRLMRTLLADLALSDAARRAQDMVDRTLRSQPR
jgi:hypothetical protein